MPAALRPRNGSGQAQHRADGASHRNPGEHQKHQQTETPQPGKAHVPSISRMRPFSGPTAQQVCQQRPAAHKATRRSRSALAMTETELKLMAAAAGSTARRETDRGRQRQLELPPHPA